MCTVLLVVIALLPAWLAPSLARGVGAAVSLSEDLADAAGAIAQVAKNAALLVSDVAVAFTKGTMSVMHEAWAGVDLADTSVNAPGARFLVIGGVARQEFEASEVAATLRPLPPDYSQWLWKCRFKTASFFDYFEFEALLFPSCYVGVRIVWTRMGFTAVWANPLWELLGVDVSSELAPIAARTRGAISDALDLDWLRAPLTDDEDEARVTTPTWFRWLQWARHYASWAKIASGSR
ncbi:unnamed protein product [Prorocentrum cordatum]|uniref:Phospholipase B-like n=1 Tax=Prorocentrum cordatum TaxID=2364126 RepID=A0ABN9VLL2_9DINO|nr:unnamed protein product [Polarella glacialis]